MNLAIDIGNSVAKLAVIEQGQVVDNFKTEELDVVYLEKLLQDYPSVDSAIVVSARPNTAPFYDLLKTRLDRFMVFDHTVAVPIRNLYRTPETLGPDRLAAAVGANALYPNHPVLIVDFGTAITFDFVTSEGEFLGGNISPGATTRFKALHHFTQKLPLRTLTDDTAFLGNSSAQAIDSGVINGIVYEVEGYIRGLDRKYPDLRIIFTGGDGNFFAKRLKNPIFAIYDLVAYGLNRILEYNAKN